MGNFVKSETILAAVDKIMTPRIEIPARSMIVSSRRDAASVTANWERGQQVGSAASENVTGRNDTFHELNVNDET